jgi:phosphoadenosine phosphosulfate reductase
MNPEYIFELNQRWAGLPAQEIIERAGKEFGNGIGFATSLGAEDQVITEMIASVDKSFRIFTLDTGRLFPETYEVLEKTRNRYGLDIEVYFPDAGEVEKMVNEKGINLFYESIENRKLCCSIRKVHPLQRAIKGMTAWITGLRRDQSLTRAGMHLVEPDEANHLIKINPLINWKEEQVWKYINERNIPFNALHNQGYPSIGCQPCTRAVENGEDIRAGRWWWELPGQKECGLHKK